MLKTLPLLLMVFLLSSCANKVKESIRDAKYSAWEMVGMEKRDLFKKEVTHVQEEQEESGEAFKDALERLQEFYAFDGGKIEKEYKKLKNSYEAAQSESKSVSKSITDLNTVAQDLFTEWQKEIKDISSKDLRVKSSQKLNQTKKKYSDLHSKLKNSESKMTPVLTKLKDQVTYLKHNLNAQAISGLKDEGSRIEKDIEILINEMNAANKEAESFIKTL